MHDIEISLVNSLDTKKVSDLFRHAEFPRKGSIFSSVDVAKIIETSNLKVAASVDGTLVGVALCMTNQVSFCYLSALVVHPNAQGQGIGTKLTDYARATAGGGKMTFLVLSTAAAAKFYESIGMERSLNAYLWPRQI